MRSPETLLGLLLAFFNAGTTEAAGGRPKRGRGPKPGRGGGSKGAPGPIAGTGLSFIALAGMSWLVRRRIKRANQDRHAAGSETRELPAGSDRGPA
jgi:hypothetical protein